MKKELLNEINRYKQLMGVVLITEAGKVADEYLPLTPRSIDNLTKSGVDFTNDLTKLSDEFTSRGIKTFADLSDVVAKKQNVTVNNITDEMIRSYIKNDEKLYSSILTKASSAASQEVDTLIKNANIGLIFSKNPSQLNAYRVYISTPPSVRNLDTLTSGLSDSINEMEKIIDEIQSGKVSGVNTIPKELQDLYDNLLSKKAEVDEFKNRQTGTNPTTVKSSNPQSYLDNLSNSELEAKLGSYSWKNLGYNQELYSGWKFHIFGEDIKDAVYLQDALKPVIDKYKPAAKVGGTYHQTADAFKPGGVQYGKQGVTIYIPPNVINAGRQQEMLADIQSALSGYNKGGTISGDQAITPNIHYRYELLGPIPKEGINYDAYSKMYSKNEGGAYKPSDVGDIFTTK